MKKIINNLVYDTDTAVCVGYYSGEGYAEQLYRKRTGEFFLHGEGDPASKYAKSIGQNEWVGSEKIIPLEFKNAKKWAKEKLPAEVFDKIFGEITSDDSRVTVTFSISKLCSDTIKRRASEKGISQGQYIESVVLK